MILRHLVSILVLPTTVTVIVPYFILSRYPMVPAAWAGSAPLRLAAILAGIGVLAVGLVLVGTTIRLFVTIGHGTLAPWDPPKHLVVAGAYRHVRNPMISGVLLILLGEALVFQSVGLLAWFVVFLSVNALYIPIVEEPELEQRFGDEYREYKRHVPPWLPRVKAWRQGGDSV